MLFSWRPWRRTVPKGQEDSDAHADQSGIKGECSVLQRQNHCKNHHGKPQEEHCQSRFAPEPWLRLGLRDAAPALVHGILLFWHL